MAARTEMLDRYALFHEIASGGMATVHLGQVVGAAGFTRIVAIKRLHRSLASDPELVTMLLDEGRLASRLRHPNIVPVLDVVQREGELFLVMEYVHGESVAAIVRGGATVSIPIALGVVTAILHGLHAAHEAVDARGRALGIVHRDVSPQNILVDGDGAVRLVDFGVAKAAWRVQTTRDGQVKGKLSYMAPEQLQGLAIDRRVDVYAASIVLWELLTGERLYATREPGDVILKVLASAPEPPSKHNPAVSRQLDEIVLRGLARTADRRFPTALEMATELESVMPPATAREIGAWMKTVAGDRLAARAAAVARVERGEAQGPAFAAPEADATPATALTAAHAEVTLSDGAITTKTPARRARPLLAVAALALIAAVLAVTYTFLGRSHAIASAPPDVTPSASPPRSPSGSLPQPTPLTAPAPASASASTSHPPSAAPSAASASSPSLSPAATARPARPRPSRPPAACDPPYYVTPTGIHMPKPECIE